MSAYPKMPHAVLAWLKKKELESYRAYDAGRELHAYAPEISYKSEPVAKEVVWECKL